MKEKFFYPVPAQYQRDYDLLRKKQNTKSLLIIGGIILGVQIFILILSRFAPFTQEPLVIQYYLRFYRISFGANLIILITLLLFWKYGDLKSPLLSALMIFYLYVLFIWAVGVAVADQFQGQDVVVLFAAMFVAAIVIEMKIQEYAFLLASCFILLKVLMMIVYDYVGDAGELMNAALQNAVLALMIRYYISELHTKNYVQRRELEFYSWFDPLSNLHNRRRWEELYHHSYQKAVEEKQPLLVILSDIDYFKQYNDSYGHVAGDDIVRKVSSVFEKCTESTEANVGRYGGDEFVVAIQNISKEEAMDLVECLQSTVRTMDVENKKSILSGKLSISVGFNYAVPDDPQGSWDFVVKADEDLYLHKKNRKPTD